MSVKPKEKVYASIRDRVAESEKKMKILHKLDKGTDGMYNECYHMTRTSSSLHGMLFSLQISNIREVVF